VPDAIAEPLHAGSRGDEGDEFTTLHHTIVLVHKFASPSDSARTTSVGTGLDDRCDHVHDVSEEDRRFETPFGNADKR
jgi:hypothetical protein